MAKCMINKKVHSRHGIDRCEGLNKNENQYNSQSGHSLFLVHPVCVIVEGFTLNVV